MSQGNSIKDRFETITDQTQELAETAVKIAQVEVTRQVAKMASSAVIFLLIWLLLNVIILIVCLGAARWINDEMNDPKIGYFIVAGGILFIILLLVATRKKLLSPFLRNVIVRKLYE